MVARLLYYSFCTLFLTAAGMCGTVFYFLSFCPFDLSPLAAYNPGRPSILLDDEGNEWGRYALDRREPVALSQVPTRVIQAFVAAEDRSFFEHQGLSLRGIIRSVFVNISSGRRAQGASTITQQLVRLLFFDARKSFIRKIKEQVTAVLVERHFSKEQILGAYLNHIYFGCGIYGVQAASQRFWSKNVQDLTCAQAAMLAAIVKSPSRYCPLNDIVQARGRRNFIINLLYKQGCIGLDECLASCQEPVLEKSCQDEVAPHARQSLGKWLERLVGRKALYTQGYKIQTTLKRETQRAAQKAFKRQIEYLQHSVDPAIDGAVLTMEVATGHIKALVGGYDYGQSQVDRCRSRRQMGSIFKPIIYSYALMHGKKFTDILIDEPLKISMGKTIWSPQNYTRRFEGPMTLAYALSYSNNMVPIKMLMEMGVEAIRKFAVGFGIPYEKMYPYPSLALGCVDVNLEQVAGSFNVFAHDGVYVEPHLVRWVKDYSGKKIFQQKPRSSRVISPSICRQVNRVLSFSMARAKRRSKKGWIDAESICKTGTTNDSRTCWFAGSTPSYTTAVYVGRDDNQPLGKNVWPFSTAFPIWLEINQGLVSDLHFSYDTSLKQQVVDLRSGVSVGQNHPEHVILLVE